MKDSNPKVTVVIPAYNSSKYIEETINSILNQSFNDFELLIINDCSNDDTLEIINSYKDNRIRVFSNEKNMGITPTRNRGLELAKGKYVTFMDHDDIAPLYKFEKQVAFLDKNPDIGIYGGSWKFFGDKSLLIKVPNYHEDIRVFSIFHCPFGSSTVMARKSMLNKYNLKYDANYPCSEDYDLWVHCLKHFKGANSDEIFLYYRIHENQASNKRSEILRNSDKKIKENILKELIPDITEDELEQHIFITINDIKKAINWINRIYDANDEKKIYSQDELHSFLKKVVYFLFYNAHYDGLKVYNEYKKSIFSTDEGKKKLFDACFRAERKNIKRKIKRFLGFNMQLT